jgi:hypothetical protein
MKADYTVYITETSFPLIDIPWLTKISFSLGFSVLELFDPPEGRLSWELELLPLVSIVSGLKSQQTLPSKHSAQKVKDGEQVSP